MREFLTMINHRLMQCLLLISVFVSGANFAINSYTLQALFVSLLPPVMYGVLCAFSHRFLQDHEYIKPRKFFLFGGFMLLLLLIGIFPILPIFLGETPDGDIISFILIYVLPEILRIVSFVILVWCGILAIHESKHNL